MKLEISGHTKLLAVIGDPVRHSLSPAIHSRFIAEAGLDYAYMAFPVKSRECQSFFEAAKTLDIAGFNVTMPLKEEAYRLMDSLHESAKGAVNTVTQKSGVFTGYSTDGDGFVNALRETGRDPSGLRVILIGAGGAARVVREALTGVGALVQTCARNPEKGFPFTDLSRYAADCDALINATPLGMTGFEQFGSFAFLDSLPPHALVFDLVYNPVDTELLLQSRRRGLDNTGGLSHLIHQAALSFRYFTGYAPDQRLIDYIRTNIHK